MTDNTRALLEQVYAMLSSSATGIKQTMCRDDLVVAIRAELAKPEQQAEQSWNRSIRDSVDVLLAEAGYRPDSSARHQLSMMNFDQKAQAAPAWHDAPEAIALKAQRDELLAALKACRLELYWCSRQLCYEGWEEGSTVKSALAAGLAAIAKAEGRKG